MFARLPHLLLLCALAACGSGVRDIDYSTAGVAADSGGNGVSGGGCLLRTGRPTAFYGTVVEAGVRRYSYLVISPDLTPDDGQVEQLTWGDSTADGENLSSTHTLSVNDVSLEVAHSARIGAAGLERESTIVAGTPAAPGQWLFLYDPRVPAVAPVPVDMPMPGLPADLERVDESTDALLDELATNNEAVRTFLEAPR